MLGGNLPVAAPIQSYSKINYLYEINLATYTLTIQEEYKKKRLNKPILRNNYLF